MIDARDYWCTFCVLHFDPVDDGTTGRGSPEHNAMRNEEYKMRQQGRLPRGRR